MARKTERSPDEIAGIYDRQFPTVWRVCFLYCKNAADTEDAVSDTFLALIRACPAFENGEHEKAWLIRTAVNLCKNRLRSPARRQQSYEQLEEEGALPEAPDVRDEEARELREAVDSLPERYRLAVYLHYFEGYSTGEIAEILKKPGSTVRNWLSEARKALRERMGEG